MSSLSSQAVVSLSVALTLLTVLVIAITVVAVYKSLVKPRRTSNNTRLFATKVTETRLSSPRLRRYSGSRLIGRDPLQESINWSNREQDSAHGPPLTASRRAKSDTDVSGGVSWGRDASAARASCQDWHRRHACRSVDRVSSCDEMARPPSLHR